MANKKKYLLLLAGVLLLIGLWVDHREAERAQNASGKKPAGESVSQVPDPALPSDRNQPQETSAAPAMGSPSLATVKEIILSHNDNDPRLDHELKSLPVSVHEELYQLYKELPPENRNGRGLVVFLIARDFKTKEDAQFLRQVYEEPPCLSLENCGQMQASDSHESSVNDNTLIYPQMAALYQLEKKLAASQIKDEQTRQGLKQILTQAENFDAPAIQKKASELIRRM